MSSSTRSLAFRGWLLALAWGVLAPAHAQHDAHMVYRLQPGDTLSSLVARLLSGPQAMDELVRTNGLANPHWIIAGETLRIPRHLVRYSPSVARVSRTQCNNILMLEPAGPVALQVGDTVPEGAVVQVPSGCHLTVMLEDRSQVRTLSGAVIRFRTLRRNALDNLPEVRMELLEGRMQVQVGRYRPAGDAPFEVRTPTSIAGVRGTEFQIAFDASARSSQIEVDRGVVAARGDADAHEQLARAGQGVVIQSSGQSLPVEDRLPAPRFQAAQAAPAGARVLRLEPVAAAAGYTVRRSSDASFAFMADPEPLDEPALVVKDFALKPHYQQWSAVSSSGIRGVADHFAFCQAYLSRRTWRCNVNFNMAGLGNPHVRLQRVESGGRAVGIVDRGVSLGPKDQMVFRGLPSGRYRWQLEHDAEGAQRAMQHGEFELVAIPAETS